VAYFLLLDLGCLSLSASFDDFRFNSFDDFRLVVYFRLSCNRKPQLQALVQYFIVIDVINIILQMDRGMYQ
jgi:hypothetical protein